jgi:hypothetical protein
MSLYEPSKWQIFKLQFISACKVFVQSWLGDFYDDQLKNNKELRHANTVRNQCSSCIHCAFIKFHPVKGSMGYNKYNVEWINVLNKFASLIGKKLHVSRANNVFTEMYSRTSETELICSNPVVVREQWNKYLKNNKVNERTQKYADDPSLSPPLLWRDVPQPCTGYVKDGTIADENFYNRKPHVTGL